MVNKILYFRTDANDIIATGHVMRCITIAKALEKKGIRCTFIVSDKQSEKLIIESGYDVIILNVNWEKLDAKNELYILNLHGIKKGILFIDSYSATEEYTYLMKKYFNIIIMDDLFKSHYAADIIINYNLYYNIFDYKKRYKSTENTLLLLGGNYVPLRKQFEIKVPDSSQIKITKKQNINLLLICGGGDRYNTMSQIINYCKKKDDFLFSKITWNVVAGAYNKYIDCLNNIRLENSNVKIYKNVSEIAELMVKNDICISAASTVLYECCAMQLPTVFYSISDDQIYDAEAFSNDNVMLYAGDFREEKIKVLENTIIYIKKIINDDNIYKYMIDNMKDIISVYGADNIANCIYKKFYL